MNAKYVIIKHGGLEIPLLCPDEAGMAHVELADGRPVVAAGFCKFSTTDRSAFAWGESVSLRVKSRGTTDSELLARLYFHQ